jgi:UDP-GlcNAc:undecaprenyl-phosphate GlcNAc-1-phosphate transferase
VTAVRRAALAATVGAAAAAAVWSGLSRAAPGRSARWERTNYRGRRVSLAAGPAVAVGAAAGALLAPGLATRHRLAAAVVALGTGVVGAYDDLAGSGTARGFRGHLSALRRGEVTTGTVKIVGIGAAGVTGSVVVGGAGPIDAFVGGAVVAGSANLLNLLDLRPGRAAKAALLFAPLALARPPAGPVAAAALGAAGALLPADLGERAMLGDAGANAVGATLGLAAVAREGRAARLAHLGALVALTVASERVSFTAVIERTPLLRWADRLGRLPADP